MLHALGVGNAKLLNSLKVQGFKSLLNETVMLPQLAVLLGPNAAGKSNILDAIQALSRLGTELTLADALSDPIRGYPIEAFSFPPTGLPGLLARKSARILLEADIGTDDERFLYRVMVEINVRFGSLSVQDEYLATLTKRAGEPTGRPRIETVPKHVLVRSRGRPGRPREEPIGLNHTKLSDRRLGGREYIALEKCRRELAGWRTYYLDPRVAMRHARAPAEVTDIGVSGENIAPFLYRLKAEKPKHFSAIKRTLRSLIPSVEDLTVDLDRRRGTLEIEVGQSGTKYSSRIISEGTLRVLALCAIAVNPWSGSLVAFEEPENGVHPRRIELIAKLLSEMAHKNQQIVVTAHSPLFCDAVLAKRREGKHDIALLRVVGDVNGTVIQPFDPLGPLFTKSEIALALNSDDESTLFENLMLRGLLDA